MSCRIVRYAVPLLCLLAGSCTFNLWASTSQSKTFFGRAELTAWVDDGKTAPRVEFDLGEVDPAIEGVLPGEHHALQLDLPADMREWVRRRLEPSRGKRSRIQTKVRSLQLREVRAKDGSKWLGGRLQLSGTVPPLAQVLLPADLDYGRPEDMDPTLLEWIGKVDLRDYRKWARYAPVDQEGKALSWADAARLLATPGPVPGLVLSAWNGRSWVHAAIPTALITARPRPALQLENDGTLTWKWSIDGKVVPASGEAGAETVATGRIALEPGPPVHVRYRGYQGVGFWGVLWRIPATPVAIVGDILLAPAVVVMLISREFGYDV